MTMVFFMLQSVKMVNDHGNDDDPKGGKRAAGEGAARSGSCCQVGFVWLGFLSNSHQAW